MKKCCEHTARGIWITRSMERKNMRKILTDPRYSAEEKVDLLIFMLKKKEAT